HILIFADNSSAITTIYKQKLITACQGYAQRFRQSIETSLLQDMVEITWCPGHDGIEDNDKADKLAKKTGKLRVPTYHTFTHAKH
ncbi:hypothetical protein F5879DRAFT_808084, partial [Lentinula edodes]